MERRPAPRASTRLGTWSDGNANRLLGLVIGVEDSVEGAECLLHSKANETGRAGRTEHDKEQSPAADPSNVQPTIRVELLVDGGLGLVELREPLCNDLDGGVQGEPDRWLSHFRCDVTVQCYADYVSVGRATKILDCFVELRHGKRANGRASPARACHESITNASPRQRARVGCKHRLGTASQSCIPPWTPHT